VENVSDKRCREEARILCFLNIFVFNYALYEMMWKNDAEPDRPPAHALCMLNN